jgi:hypothetical protein
MTKVRKLFITNGYQNILLGTKLASLKPRRRVFMRQLFVIPAILLLAACDHYEADKAAAVAQVEEDAGHIADNSEKNAMRVADNVRDSIKRTGERVRKWWITPLPEQKKQPVRASYCYHALQDILCYRQPMPGWEHRLVGYQGTGAAPPPVAMMQPLPVRKIDESQLPRNRVTDAKPIFVEMPTDVKDMEKEQLPDEETLPAVHERLPDPTLAPQL